MSKTIIAVRKDKTMPGKYLCSVKPPGGRSTVDYTAGYEAGEAAAHAVSIAISHGDATIIACDEVMQLIPDIFKS